jgi:hypothetical protein
MKEALKLALEVLMDNEHYIAENERIPYVVLYNKVIEKCKAALAQPAQREPLIAFRHGCKWCGELNGCEHKQPAQPAQDPWCMKMNGCTTKCEDCPDKPAQEPVAWLDEEKKIIYWHNTHETDDYHGFRRSTPLYTTPPKREWVGLTDEDKETLILKHAPPLHSDYEDDSLHGLLQAANDFLKELNT